jgi:diguanylate cyclase
MEYTHSSEQSDTFAAQALRVMKERSIPPNPNNFMVWYCYHSGEFPDLREALDLLLNSGRDLTPERSASVVRKFCSGPYEAIPLHLIAERCEAELTAVLAALGQAGERAAEYGRSLENAHGQMLSATRGEELCQVIARVLAQTRAMGQQSRDVEDQLRRSLTEVSQLRDELDGARREAMSDALTGLANRKMFEFTLREAAMDSMDTGEPVSLLLLDIDHFKTFNDSYGHNVGDHVLKLLALVLRESVKGQDTPSRYGGEEFAIILPRTKLSDAAKLAENIRLRVAGKRIIHRKTGEHLGRVSVSIGVAQYTVGESLGRFVERVDQALYFAKRTGRNKVVCEADVSDQVAVGS